MPQIVTPRGKFHYTLQPLYAGRKKMNKEQAQENLFLFYEIAQKYDLHYLLGWGTLLGAIREHDFIGHDEDIDLLLPSEETGKLLEMLWDLQQCDFYVSRYEHDFLSIMRGDEYIDIYIYAPYKEGVRLCHNTLFLPEHIIMETIEYTFLGKIFRIPKQYMQFLVAEYGEDWNVPIIYNVEHPSLKKVIYYKMKMYIKSIIPSRLLMITFFLQRRRAFKQCIDKYGL